MESATPTLRGRRLDEIAEALPQRAAAISRLFLANSRFELSRTEAGVMRALFERPRRITELAQREAVTQPAISMLVKRLEDRGFVAREVDPDDGRAVLVKLTAEGRETFDALRTEYRALLQEEMESLSDRDVAALARAVEILDTLVERLKARR